MKHGNLLAELLYQVVSLSGVAREDLLRDIGAEDPALGREIRSLLPHAERESGLLPRSLDGDDEPRANEDSLVGTNLGRYQLIRLLGQGGMGRVYLASQSEPLRRQVAIKVIHPGMDTESVLRRFRNERRSLSRLQHPNVARIIDAGTDESGRPFLVMELADGPPLDEYCAVQELRDDDMVRLFLQACEGVAHAHGHGILHRDLKPSNILVVNEGNRAIPKVIDFGIATMLHDVMPEEETFERTVSGRHRHPVGTIGWMSPEQLGGFDLDVRSDVHGMGLILYRLIAGRSPWSDPSSDRSVGEFAMDMRGFLPLRPSRWRKKAGGSTTNSKQNRELDWICLKAIAPERERRYESMRAFVRDLEKFLDREPVSAAPLSAAYRAKKYVQRHRGPLLALTALAIFALTTISILVRSNRRVRVERQRAVRAFEDSRTAINYLGQTLSSENPHIAGPETTVHQMLTGALESFEGETQGSERVRGWIRPILASALINVEAYESAAAQLALSEREVERHFGDVSPEMAHLFLRRAALFDHQQQPEETSRLAERALSILDRLDSRHPKLRLRAMAFRGLAGTRLGREVSKGNTMLDEALAFAGEQGLDKSFFTIRIGVWRAGGARLAGEHDEAEAMLAGLLDKVEQFEDPRRWSMKSIVQAELGALLIERRRSKEALQLLDSALELRIENLGEASMKTLSVRESRAVAMMMTGRREEALSEFESVAAGFQSHLGEQSARVLRLKSNLLGMLLMVKRSERVLEQATPLIRKLAVVYGDDSIQVAQAIAIRGKAHLLGEDYDSAVDDLERAAAIYRLRESTGLRIYKSITIDLDRARRALNE